MSINTANLYALYRIALNTTGLLGNVSSMECPVNIDLPWPMFAFSNEWPSQPTLLDEKLDTFRHFIEKGMCPSMVIVPRSAEMESVEHLFPKNGFGPLALWPAMNRVFREDESNSATGHTFIVSNDKQLEQWLHIVNEVHFPLKKISKSYFTQIAQSQGISLIMTGSEQAPVAACLAFDNGQSVGVYMVATLPNHRRMGYSTNMLHYLAHSTNKTLILQATLSSAKHYKRIGFIEVGDYMIYRLK